MSETATHLIFDPNPDLEALPREKLITLCEETARAYQNLMNLWRGTVTARWDDETCDEIAREVAPLAVGGGVDEQFRADLDLMARVVKAMPELLTFGRYEAGLLPEPLDARLEVQRLSPRALVLLWNIAALTYMTLTGRWYEAAELRLDSATAMSLEKEVWLDRGGAEHDLRIGLEAAGVEGASVADLLRGFQLAPGEVGLLEVEFRLDDPNHGWLIHRRCPAWDRFRDEDVARREHACVICVIGMRLSGELVNRGMRCRAASLPPYRDPVDYACQWEYWLEEDV